MLINGHIVYFSFVIGSYNSIVYEIKCYSLLSLTLTLYVFVFFRLCHLGVVPSLQVNTKCQRSSVTDKHSDYINI